MVERICLIVDDEPVIRTFLRTILQSERIQSLEAEDAGQALKMIHRLDGRLDLVITDIRMPGDMDGLDLAHSIRNTYPGIPIILVSAWVGEENIDSTQHFELIRKPFLPEAILDAAKRAMDSCGGEKSEAAAD